MGQTGTYSVVVMGACNSVTSTAFSLSLGGPLSVSITPTATTICTGTSTVLTASGAVGTPGTTYA